MAKKRIDTMLQLSTEIGVSRATLSKYFQDPSLVRHSTAKKIADQLDAIDYVPNFFARNLQRRQTGILGVVLPHLNDPFYMRLLREIEYRAQEFGFSILVQNSHNDPDKEVQAVSNLRSMNAEGAIIAPMGVEENGLAFTRLAEDVPLVFVDAKCPGLENDFSFVGTDNDQSIGLMVDYLCRSGTAPKFLSMPKVNSNALERQKAFITKMEKIGVEPEVIDAPSGTETWDFEHYGYDRISALISQGISSNSTILCANDRLAMGALRAANERGLLCANKSGQDCFRVAGHDDHPLSKYLWPALTTVSQDVQRIGHAAVDCMFQTIRGGENADKLPSSNLFPAQLWIRESA